VAEERALADHFRAFAESSTRDGASTYAAISRSVADDAELLELLARAPLTQRRPNLLLAAVHFLLLGGEAHPLATHYDTVAAFWGTEPGAPVGDVGAQFKDFCMTHRDGLLGLIATGSTQTNEVGRCTALLPALSHIAAMYGHGEPMGLLDLGTSAGLNLYFDRYAYTYRQRSDGAAITAGDPSADVKLECTVRGEFGDLPSLTLPAMADRAGLDRAPIDPHDEAGARWLLACLWPDHLPRFARLRAALEIARRDTSPPARHTGDMVDQLGAVAATVAPGQPLVVFHSWVAAYLTEARQRELVEAVRSLPPTRPVHYLYAESPVETAGLPTPPPPEPHAAAQVATVLVHVPPGGAAVRLADMHHHGRSLRWWPRPTPRATAPTEHHAEPGPAPRRR
jgi:hypothetical protein